MSLASGIPLDRVPGLEPPPGVVPNFVNPENYQNKVIACLAVFLAIATFFTAIKLIQKQSLSSQLRGKIVSIDLF